MFRVRAMRMRGCATLRVGQESLASVDLTCVLGQAGRRRGGRRGRGRSRAPWGVWVGRSMVAGRSFAVFGRSARTREFSVNTVWTPGSYGLLDRLEQVGERTSS